MTYAPILGHAACIVTVFFLCTLPTSTRENFWSERIVRDGVAKAYESVPLVAREHGTGAHDEAHRFAAALYALVGIRGVAWCDAQYSYGCTHEFLARAVLEHGADAMQIVASVCGSQRAVIPCMHGVGHGFLHTAGYSEVGLVQATTLCGELGDSDAPLGCVGGVFMEYFHNTMRDGLPRPVDLSANNPFSICRQVGENTRRICAFWVPVWLRTHMHVEPPTGGITLERLQMICSLAPLDLRSACFSGLGYAGAFEYKDDPKGLGLFCAQADSNRHHTYRCASIGALYAHQNSGISPQEVCNAMSHPLRTQCVEFAQRTPYGAHGIE